MKPKLIYVKPSECIPHPAQTRKDHEEIVERIAESLEKPEDLVEPPRIIKFGDGYMVVSGEMRWRAYKLVFGTKNKMPAVLVEGDEHARILDHGRANLIRENLEPDEAGEYFEKVGKEYKLYRGNDLNATEIARKVYGTGQDKKLNTNRQYVRQCLNAHHMEEPAKKILAEANITDYRIHGQIGLLNGDHQIKAAKLAKKVGTKARDLIPIVRNNMSTQPVKTAVLNGNLTSRKVADKILAEMPEELHEKAVEKAVEAIKETNENKAAEKIEAIGKIAKSNKSSLHLVEEITKKDSKITPKIAEVIQKAKKEDQLYLITKAKKYIATDSEPVTIAKTERALERTIEPETHVKDTEKKLLENMQKTVTHAIGCFHWSREKYLSERGKKLANKWSTFLQDFLREQQEKIENRKIQARKNIQSNEIEETISMIEEELDQFFEEGSEPEIDAEFEVVE